MLTDMQQLGKSLMIPKTMSIPWHSTQTDSWIAKPYSIPIHLFLALGGENALELRLHIQRYLLLSQHAWLYSNLGIPKD